MRGTLCARLTIGNMTNFVSPMGIIPKPRKKHSKSREIPESILEQIPQALSLYEKYIVAPQKTLSISVVELRCRSCLFRYFIFTRFAQLESVSIGEPVPRTAIRGLNPFSVRNLGSVHVPLVFHNDSATAERLVVSFSKK